MAATTARQPGLPAVRDQSATAAAERRSQPLQYLRPRVRRWSAPVAEPGVQRGAYPHGHVRPHLRVLHRAQRLRADESAAIGQARTGRLAREYLDTASGAESAIPDPARSYHRDRFVRLDLLSHRKLQQLQFQLQDRG